jgi:glycerol-3-phosphate dehydrogenase (NAD(P)+)
MAGPTSPKEPETARRKVCVLGLGQMGLVCAGILAGKTWNGSEGTAAAGRGSRARGGDEREAAGGESPRRTGGGRLEVVLWGHSADEAGSLTQTRRSPRLPGFVLPDAVRVTAKVGEAVAGASLIVSAIPVQFMRGVWEGIRSTGRLPRPGACAVVSVAKGIENGTLLRPTQVIAEVLGEDPDARPRAIGVLSGPTIAAELARCLPATMVAASDQAGFSAQVQRLFATSWLRVYTLDDVLGVELAGAVKNVIAIAAGVLDGLQAGYNAKSALLARGLAEITRLGVAMGANQATFFGLAGVGDLATSCFSPEGRNRSCGEALGRGMALKEYLSRTESVVEGVATARSVVDLARKYRVDMPIAEAVYAVLYEGMDPLEGIGRLMSRELKAERVG